MSKIVAIFLTIALVFTASDRSTSQTEINSLPPTMEEDAVIEEVKEEISPDEEVISYISSVDAKIETITEKETITKDDESLLRKYFIIITDFLFYDGKINGKTFNDLTNEAKLEVLNLYTALDQKIASCYPNYKEDIKEASTKIYVNTVEKAKKLKTSLEEKYKQKVGIDQYNQTKEAYEENKERLKAAYNTTVDKVKEKASSAKEDFTEWYKSYKNGVE